MERIAKLVLVLLAVVLVVLGLALFVVWNYGLGPKTSPTADTAVELSPLEREEIVKSLGPEATSSPYYRLNPVGEAEVTSAGQAVRESLGAN